MIILSWFIIGLVVGWLTSFFRIGSGLGIISDIIIGISGAILGGFMVSLLINSSHLVEGLNIDNLFGSLTGSILAVILIGALPEPPKENL